MRDVRTEESAPTALDRLLLAELRPPGEVPDLSNAIMARVREEALHVARPIGQMSGQSPFVGTIPPWRGSSRPIAPPPLSGSVVVRPALSILGGFSLAVVALLLWSGTPSGERWLSVLGAAVDSPLFLWVAGTLAASAAAIAVPMVWMDA